MGIALWNSGREEKKKHMRRDDTYSRLTSKASILISKTERKREKECTRMRKSDREYDIKRNVTLSHCVRQIQTVLQYTAKIFHISGSQASHLEILLRENRKGNTVTSSRIEPSERLCSFIQYLKSQFEFLEVVKWYRLINLIGKTKKREREPNWGGARQLNHLPKSAVHMKSACTSPSGPRWDALTRQFMKSGCWKTEGRYQERVRVDGHTCTLNANTRGLGLPARSYGNCMLESHSCMNAPLCKHMLTPTGQALLEPLMTPSPIRRSFLATVPL